MAFCIHIQEMSNSIPIDVYFFMTKINKDNAFCFRQMRWDFKHAYLGPPSAHSSFSSLDWNDGVCVFESNIGWHRSSFGLGHLLRTRLHTSSLRGHFLHKVTEFLSIYRSQEPKLMLNICVKQFQRVSMQLRTHTNFKWIRIYSVYVYACLSISGKPAFPLLSFQLRPYITNKEDLSDATECSQANKSEKCVAHKTMKRNVWYCNPQIL